VNQDKILVSGLCALIGRITLSGVISLGPNRAADQVTKAIPERVTLLLSCRLKTPDPTILISEYHKNITKNMSVKAVNQTIRSLNGPASTAEKRHSKTQSAFNYDNTSSNLAATTMKNELSKLVTTAPPEAREVCISHSPLYCMTN